MIIKHRCCVCVCGKHIKQKNNNDNKKREKNIRNYLIYDQLNYSIRHLYFDHMDLIFQINGTHTNYLQKCVMYFDCTTAG